MRFTPTILPLTATPTKREVKGLSNVHSVKPVHERDPDATPEYPHSETQGEHRPQPQGEHPHSEHQSPPQGEHQPPQHGLPIEDRRKACRRIHHQKVLIELRSGLDRRQHNLLEGGTADHIDEQA